MVYTDDDDGINSQSIVAGGGISTWYWMEQQIFCCGMALCLWFALSFLATVGVRFGHVSGLSEIIFDCCKLAADKQRMFDLQQQLDANMKVAAAAQQDHLVNPPAVVVGAN